MLAAEFLKLANNSFLQGDQVNYNYFILKYKKEIKKVLDK